MSENNSKQKKSTSEAKTSAAHKTDLIVSKHRNNFNNNYFAKINERIRLFILTKKIINEKKHDK